MIKQCLVCGKDFYTKPSYVRVGGGKYCSMHCYHKSDSYSCPAGWNYGVTLPPEKKGKNHFNFKGGEHIHEGYVFVLSPFHPYRRKNNYVKRSRLIVESIIKRFLLPNEIIHHINHTRTDDRPENLYIFSKKEHDKFHGVEHNHKLVKNKLISNIKNFINTQ